MTLYLVNAVVETMTGERIVGVENGRPRVLWKGARGTVGPPRQIACRGWVGRMVG